MRSKSWSGLVLLAAVLGEGERGGEGGGAGAVGAGALLDLFLDFFDCLCFVSAVDMSRFLSNVNLRVIILLNTQGRALQRILFA